MKPFDIVTFYEYDIHITDTIEIDISLHVRGIFVTGRFKAGIFHKKGWEGGRGITHSLCTLSLISYKLNWAISRIRDLPDPTLERKK